jgi:hypothetical protein
MEEKQIKKTVDSVIDATTGQKMSLDDYFKRADVRVRRGELADILTGILDQIDGELNKSFSTLVSVVNMSEIMLEALTQKGLLTVDDVVKAKQTLVNNKKKEQKEKKKDEKGGQENNDSKA